MDKIVQVQHVAVHCCTAKEAMKKVVEYMKYEPINVVELVTMQTLMKVWEQEELLHLQEFDLMVAGNKEVLEAAGVTESRYSKEADDMLFFKMFLRYLHKNHKRVFVLTEESAFVETFCAYAKERYAGVQIVGTASMEEHGISDDMIVNKVNGTETDCIVAFLSSPLQEQFVIRNRSLLNARMWIGLGRETEEKLSGRIVKNRLKKFFTRQFLKNKIKKL